MRTITAAQQAVIDSGVQGEHVRVLVRDAGATFRDLTTYPGFNAVQSVSWKEMVGADHATADITLSRELYALSLAPLMTDSALNRGFNPGASYGPLLALNRELKIEVAITPMDVPPESGDWFEVFRGRIDSLDAGSGKSISVACRALSGRLAQQFIKTERVYSYAADDGAAVALRIWAPNTEYEVGEYLVPATRGTDDPGFEKFYVCSQAGLSDTFEPTWDTSAGIIDGDAEWDYVGAPSSSGNPVEEILQNLLDDNLGIGDTAVTLYTPVSPSWDIREFLQQREFTWNALRALVDQIGWDIRYKWRSGTAQFELTFYDPPRASPTVLFTFGPEDYGDVEKLAVNIAEIRNHWRVIYSDTIDLWPDNTPKRKVIEVSDTDSINKYGDLFAEIQEDSASQIDSSTEATTLAENALSDCMEPTADLSVTLNRGFPWVEVNDFFEFSPNGLQFDNAQELAATGWVQTFETGKLRTKLECRGLPSVGANRWIEKTLHPNIPPKGRGHQLQNFGGRTTPEAIISATVGGAHIYSDAEIDKVQLAEEFEHHIYKTPGDTLDAGTLKAVTRSKNVEISDLVPGEVYYHRSVPRSRNAERLVRGEPSAEKAFTAGQAATGHLGGEPEWGRRPLNGGFESRSNPTALPDHWTAATGAATVIEGDAVDVKSGRRCLEVDTDANFDIITDRISIGPGPYSLNWWAKLDSGTTGEVELYWKAYLGDGGVITGVGGVVDTIDSAVSGDWEHRGAVINVPESDSVAYIAIGVRRGSSGDIVMRFDEVALERVTSTPIPSLDAGTSRTTTSSSFASMGAVEAIQAIAGKRIRYNIGTSIISAGAGSTGVALRVHATYPDGSTEDTAEVRFYFNDADKHHSISLHGAVTGSPMTGIVNLTLQWRRFTGTGTLTQNADDYTTLLAGE